MSDLFSLDSFYDFDKKAYHPVFKAVRFGPRWNGWLTPVVDFPTMVTFTHYLNQFDESDHYDVLRGGVLLITPYERDEKPYTIEPDPESLYDFGQLGYTFVSVEEQ